MSEEAKATAEATAEIDAQETREWLDALSAVIEREGPERAHALLEELLEHARQQSIDLPFSATTGYVNTLEPTQVGADIMAGSLIKNPGGGLAPTGGYIVGRDKLVELASYRLTAPGMGDELGASLANNRLLFQGLFLAPHVVAQAIKGALFAAGMFANLGYKTLPLPTDVRGDIIQAIELGTAEKMVAFCGGIQKYSPVDSYAAPEPWDMPGYADKIIMAAGTFVQGASIEFSADGPMRAPYNVYLQGGLTMEHAMIGIMGAAQAIEDLDQ